MHVQSVQNYWVFLSVKYANFWLSCHRCHFACSSFLFTCYNVSRQLPISCFLLFLKNHSFQPNILRPVRELKKANEMEKLSRNTGINWRQLTFLVVYLITRNCRDTLISRCNKNYVIKVTRKIQFSGILTTLREN